VHIGRFVVHKILDSTWKGQHQPNNLRTVATSTVPNNSTQTPEG
jgi:hypothetical protein